MAEIPWESQLISYFDQLTMEAESIKRASNYMLINKGEATRVVVLWYNEFRSSSDRHLVLLYLANDVVQLAKPKNALVFISHFSKVLPYALSRISRAGKDRQKAERVLKLWKSRSIFDSETCSDLLKAFDMSDMNVLNAIDSGNDTAEEILSDSSLVEASSFKPVKRSSASVDLSDKINALFDIVSFPSLLDRMAEMEGVIVIEKEVKAEMVDSKISNMLLKLETDESIGVERAMEMSRIERLFSDLNKIKNEQSKKRKRVDNNSEPEHDTDTDKFTYIVSRETLSVDLVELKNLSLEQNEQIEKAKSRHEELLESLTDVQEIFEADLSKHVENKEALEGYKKTYNKLNQTHLSILETLNKKLQQRFKQEQQDKKTELTSALDKLTHKLKPRPPPQNNGWASFMK